MTLNSNLDWTNNICSIFYANIMELLVFLYFSDEMLNSWESIHSLHVTCNMYQHIFVFCFLENIVALTPCGHRKFFYLETWTKREDPITWESHAACGCKIATKQHMFLIKKIASELFHHSIFLSLIFPCYM